MAKAANATKVVRVKPDVYAELVRRQTRRFRLQGSRPSLADLLAEAVEDSKDNTEIRNDGAGRLT
jgi:hypothetical protein